MPFETNLSTYPYNDDHDVTKNFHQILFKPSVPVQARELNQLQTLLNQQIERFGDSIYKRGTIVSGCPFRFYNNYPYAKILDTETDGTIAIPSLYNGMFAKNSSNLQAYIVDYQDGFESADPDLKTLYFDYINSGNSGTLNAFSSGDTLTIFDSNNSVYKISITDGSLGFSNTDTVIITPAIAVNVSTGSWSTGDYLLIPATGANLEVVTVDTATLADKDQVLLYVKPRDADLANGSANSTIWTLVQDADVIDTANTKAGVIENIFGTGATANIVTTSTGKVANVNMISLGEGYKYTPLVNIKSPNNSTGISGLTLSAQNYYAKVQIASVGNAVGNGYAFGIGEGVIFQKGQFIRVSDQTLIIDKYSTSPNNVAVGFDTLEEIINSNIDSSLLDNNIENNTSAPGADRLKLTPVLTKQANLETLSANTDFFILVEWNEGQPYKQNQFTQYSQIGEEMANRQFDSTGNFVVDTFQVVTSSPSTVSDEAKYYTAVVDPGQAYISGYKTQTRRNYRINVTKGIDTKTVNNNISLNYGNYTRVKELGGTFLISTGDTIDLYDTAKGFLSNSSLIESGNTAAVGTKIGEARARSLTLENGVAGEANAIFRLYLFDINMNPGKDFASVKSIHYAGTNEGICDTVLDLDPTTQTNITKIEGTKNNRLIFKAGVESLKNSNTTNYIYRTIDQNAQFSNSGLLVKSIAASPNEFYPYSGTLTDAQMKELYVVPTGNTLYAYINATGTVAVNATSNVIIGTSTAFISDFEVGDYVQVYGTALNNDIRRVVSIVNNEYMTTDKNFTFESSGSAIYRTFPKHVPIPFGSRDGLSANVDANSNILTLDLGITLQGIANVNTSIVTNIQRQNVTSTSKTAVRDRYVKIRVANNTQGNSGPWCLGVPDVFRLKGVWVANVSTVNTNSTEISAECYIDNNQTSNYLDLSWLYINPLSRYNITDDDYILVKFDYFTKSGAGYFDTVSYLGTANAEQIFALDSTPVANLTTSAISWEVPEVYTTKDEYYDLLNCFDFRPSVSNTVAPNTSVTDAPVNPPSTKSFGNTADPNNDFKFPYPDGIMTTQIEHYLGRIDHICISGKDGNIFVLKGQADVDPRKRYEPNHPKDALKLQVISVPAYPAIPRFLSETATEQLSTGIANEKRLQLRTKAHTVIQLLSTQDMQLSQPMVYTMEDIGNLERRIRDLEYYQSLSVLETSITNKQIPSSVDRTLNRFKFGFIADDFETQLYSDIDNPQYAADIEVEGDYTFGQYRSPIQTDQSNTQPVDALTKSIFSNAKVTKKITYRLVPPKYSWMHKHYVGNLDYSERLLISQPYATEPVDPVTNIRKDKCVVGRTAANSSYNFYTVTTGNPKRRIDYVQFGIDAGTATLYFYGLSGSMQILVYQGNDLVASTNSGSTTLYNLSAADKAFVSTNNYARGYYNTGAETLDLTKNYEQTGNSVKYSGKLQWTHNPVAGTNVGTVKYRKNIRRGASDTNYRIVVIGSNGATYKYLLKYPNTGVKGQTTQPCKKPNPGNKTGTMQIVALQQWSCSKQFITNVYYTNRIQVVCTGLKPKTRFNFYLDGVQNDDDVKQVGKKRGDPLVSDAKGKLHFDFFIDETWLTKIKGPGGVYKTFNNGKTFGSTGYTLFEVKGNGSSARRPVPNRAPTKLLK